MKHNLIERSTARYWMIAPMESKRELSKLFEAAWEYDRQHGTIAIGGCCDFATLQNVSQFMNYDEFQAEKENVKPNWQRNMPKIIWDFHRNIEKNDVIIARRGRDQILGIGIVKGAAYYDFEKGEKRIGVSSLEAGKFETYIKPRFREVFWAITGKFKVAPQKLSSNLVQEIDGSRYQKLLGALEGAKNTQYQNIYEALELDSEALDLLHEPKYKRISTQRQNPNYYIGIDLGTTNSVMAWGSVNPRTKLLEPNIVPIDMMTEYNAMQKKELLPSCVYFERGQAPNVGKYAKNMLQRQPDRVIKSIKKEIGTQKQFNFDGITYCPTEILSQILRHLAAGAKSHFGSIPNDAIITIPAFFDFNMRTAIVEAARLAGFQTMKRAHSILLTEPHAILLNRINQENRGETTTKVLINSDVPKLVLIFDLGGGPLKVSLHEVSYHTKQNMLYVEDIAISRYTQLSGDDFDQELADHFLKTYVSKHSLTPDDSQMDLLKNTFQEYAEQAKIELSEQIKFDKELGNWDPNLSMTPTIIRKPFENKEFRHDLSLKEYERIIQRFLASKLTLDAVDQPNTMETMDDNIIYPILDVLRKGKAKIGVSPQAVSVVLLNGGMTKLHAIQRRLENLFDFPPLVPQDPDGAVARGAVAYHHKLCQDDLYWGFEQPQRIFLHQKLKPPRHILNKTVAIEMEKKEATKLIYLVKSGTFLPMVYPECFDMPVKVGETSVRLIFEIGTKTKDKLRVIKEVQFGRSLEEKDTPLSMQVRIDENGVLSLKGYPKNSPDRRLLAVEVNLKLSTQGNYLTPKVDVSNYLDIKREVEELTTNFEQLMLTNDLNIQKVILYRIETQRSIILQDANAEKFVAPLCNLVNSPNLDDFGKMLTINLLGDLTAICSHGDLIYEIYEVTKKLISPEEIKTNGRSYVNSIAKSAVETIGKTGLSLAGSAIFDLLNLDEPIPIRSTVIHSIGKCCDSIEAVERITPFMEQGEDANRIAANWALGKIGSREKKEPLRIEQMTPVITILNEQLKMAGHNNIKRNCIYAIAEICDRRKCANDVVSIGTAVEVILQLVSFLSEQIDDSLSDDVTLSKSNSELQEVALLAIQMIRGVDLSSDQEANLHAIREEN